MSIEDIALKYDLVLLLVFGSCNTKNFTEKSDIDIAFKSATPLINEEKLNLIKDLINYFRRDKIDLVDLDKATPLLLYEIACNGKVLFEKDNSFLKYKLYASFRYADTKHLRESRRKYLNKRILELEKKINT